MKTTNQTANNVSKMFFALTSRQAGGFTGRQNFAVTREEDGKLFGAVFRERPKDSGPDVWRTKSAAAVHAEYMTAVRWVRLFASTQEAWNSVN